MLITKYPSIKFPANYLALGDIDNTNKRSYDN